MDIFSDYLKQNGGFRGAAPPRGQEAFRAWEEKPSLTAGTAEIFHWVEARRLGGIQGLGWRWSIYSTMHELEHI